MIIYIYPNLKKDNSALYTEKACEILASRCVEITMDATYRAQFQHIAGLRFGAEETLAAQCDVILVVGGDGTILKCAKLAARHQKPMLGLNCGRLGFMASLEHSELHLLEKFCTGEFTLNKRMMLDAHLRCADGREEQFTALNDVILTKTDGSRIVDFSVTKNGRVIYSVRADGLIFSTPTGATAYALSAGGPLIEPDMQCIEFTPICPHSLFSRSMIFSPETEVSVRYQPLDGHSTVVMSADGGRGVAISAQDTLFIKKSADSISLVDITGGSFFASVNRKLIKPLKDDTAP
ncbi:MAG: NAD(+)/NADH kinase [Oscillospiraceae bacterium]